MDLLLTDNELILFFPIQEKEVRIENMTKKGGGQCRNVGDTDTDNRN